MRLLFLKKIETFSDYLFDPDHDDSDSNRKDYKHNLKWKIMTIRCNSIGVFAQFEVGKIEAQITNVK